MYEYSSPVIVKRLADVELGFDA